jgi:hypothetical protein
MNSFTFKPNFWQSLRRVKNFPELLVCAKVADADQVGREIMDLIDPSTIRRVSEVMIIAEKFIQGRPRKFIELFLSFSTFSGRLMAIESFVEKHPPKNAVAAITLIEMISEGAAHVCHLCHPRALAISLIIREMAQPFIKPTSKSTALELAAMAKLVKGSSDGSDILPEESIKQIEEIAACAKRFKIADTIAIARTLSDWTVSNGLMLDLLKRVKIKTADEAEQLLESTHVETAGGRELINEIIYQMGKCSEKIDIAYLLSTTDAFEPIDTTSDSTTESCPLFNSRVWWPGSDSFGAIRANMGLNRGLGKDSVSVEPRHYIMAMPSSLATAINAAKIIDDLMKNAG